ncbi:MAG: hypothetical protein ABI999_14000 [Acidobacteriota bacterium]
MYRSLLFALLLCAVTITATAQTKTNDAREVVNRSIAAMGGIEKLRGIKLIHSRSLGHFYFLEQSERPEGPWYVDYQKTEEWRDVENGGVRRNIGLTGIQEGRETDIVMGGVSVSDMGNGLAPNPNNIAPIDELLAMAPERILLIALDASDLRYGGTEMVQSSPSDIVEFTWKGSPVKVAINHNTNLITMTDVVRARPAEQFWGIWGDFSVKNYYSYWMLQKGGFRYPQQVDTFYNGQPLRTDTILSVEFNVEPPKQTFQISDDLRTAYTAVPKRMFPDLPLGRPDRPPIQAAPDFTIIPGNWNVTLIKQDDGIVIIEAPISSAYSAKVIAEVKRRYPTAKIKCVISTSDSFPHFGGLREYAAAGIPIYALDLNEPIIRRLLWAEYKSYPDSLEKDPSRKKVKLNIVRGRTVIGTGRNQLVLYPIRSETGERMTMIYAPQLKLLYGADLVQPLPTGGFFMPQYLTELSDAATRENLDVQQIFAIHCRPTPWKQVLAFIAESVK